MVSFPFPINIFPMKASKKPGNIWIAVLFAAVPFLWVVPTYYYLKAETTRKNQACQANLSRLGDSFKSYVQKHDGKLPPADEWIAAIGREEAPELLCPAAARQDHPSYAMNSNLTEKKLSELENPETLILLYESTDAKVVPFGRGEDIADIGRENTGRGRHNQIAYRFNYFLMADGTVIEAGTETEVEPLRWTP